MLFGNTGRGLNPCILNPVGLGARLKPLSVIYDPLT